MNDAQLSDSRHEEERLADLLLRWEEAREAGEDLAAAALCADCPNLADELARRIDLLRRMHWLCTAPVEDQSAAAAVSTLRPGDRLGDYLLIEEIGAGAMGRIFRARHERMVREVAVKVIADGVALPPLARARFRREIPLHASLDHPNIVRALDAGEESGVSYLVVEYLSGQTLAEYVQRRGPLPIAETIGILRQAATGLAYAHSRGVVHRDVKPSNLFLERDGRVKLLDLGIARLARTAPADNGPRSPTPPPGNGDHQHDGTLTGLAVGTPAYAAPEQLSGATNVDARADVYSLGCTLWFMLTGQPPPASRAHHADRLAKTPRNIRSQSSKGLSDLCGKMMAADMDERLSSMDEVIAALDVARGPNGRRRTATAIVGALLLLTLFVAWWFREQQSEVLIESGEIAQLNGDLEIHVICTANNLEPKIWHERREGTPPIRTALLFVNAPGGTWDQANRNAQRLVYRGVVGQLATITSPEKEAFIKSEFSEFSLSISGASGKPRSMWIGLRARADKASAFEWNNGELLEYTNWVSPNEPSTPQQKPFGKIGWNDSNGTGRVERAVLRECGLGGAHKRRSCNPHCDHCLPAELSTSSHLLPSRLRRHRKAPAAQPNPWVAGAH